jgi:hypothetical protein
MVLRIVMSRATFDAPAVLRQALRLERLDALAAPDLAEDPDFLIVHLGRDDALDLLADHLLGCVAEQALRALVPGRDAPLERLRDDRRRTFRRTLCNCDSSV